MLTRQVYQEHGERGIRSLGFASSPVTGDMQAAICASAANPVRRLADADYIAAEWVAEAVARLCSPAADLFSALRRPVGSS